MPGSIKEIAERARVSRGTVDRALNHRGGVNKETAEKIQRIADALGYKPNVVGKALASQRKPVTIGVVINNIGNPFFDDVLLGIADAQKEIRDFGFNIKIRTEKGYDPQKQLKDIQNLVDDGIEGLVITPVTDARIVACLNKLIDDQMRVVCCNLDIPGVNYLAYVGCDYFKSGQTAGEMIGLSMNGKGNLDIVGCSNAIYCHRLRVEGCLDVLSKNYPGIKINQIIEVDDDDEIAFGKTFRMLSDDHSINALYFSAAGTSGGLEAVKQLDLVGKIQIFTFDSIPVVVEAIKNGIVLATIDQQAYVQGYRSVRTLFDAILNSRLPESDHLITELNVKLRYNI